MNHVLDSPLEALAFNYVSFGIFSLVNNLWPLVAVITAAVSFWRIKAAAGITSVKKLVDDHTPAAPLPCVNHREELSSSTVEEEPSTSCSSPATVVTPDQSESYDGVTKGRNKFVLYYHDDGREMTVASEEKEYWSDRDDSESEEWWGRNWERVLRMRTAEMEWYRYQDLTVINGNVVRLWEEFGGGKVQEQAHSSGCVVW